MELSFFSADPLLLLLIFIIDVVVGDPHTKFHPVVLLGRLLKFLENKIFEPYCWNRLGGILLFLSLSIITLSLSYFFYLICFKIHPWLGFSFLAILGSSTLAFKSLIVHARAVSPGAEGDLESMRKEVGKIVGRETNKMDEKGCRRAAIESLAESLVDGILTPIFFFVVAGLPGMLVFKVISTMDSMVGYKNDRYLYFGWAGARLDDVFNWIPARLSWLSLTLVASFIPKAYSKYAYYIGWRDQHYLPGFNSGWPEAAMAGALNCRLVGPIWRNGQLATDLWLGDEHAPEGGSKEHILLAEKLVIYTTLLWMVLGCGILFMIRMT